MLNNAEGLDRAFHAMADSTRRAMVDRLTRGPASVSELAKPFAMSLPAVLQHLQVLEAGGIVTTQKIGRVRTAQIEPVALRGVEQWIAQRRTRLERQLDRLGDFLAETADTDHETRKPDPKPKKTRRNS